VPDAPSVVDVSKNLIRERAARFVNVWEGVTSEQAEKQTFWNEFLAVFGIERRQVAAFEQLAQRASTGNVGWIDLLYPGQMAVEHKSSGKNLDEAMGQLLDYVPSLHKSEFPWLLVVCDFEHFVWQNLDTEQKGEFTLAELPDNLHLFWWMAGHGTPQFAFENEEEANLHATALMAKLHDGLLASGYDPHALREWLTRILFCLFADDTEVWDRAAFHTYVARNTRFDGADLGPALALLFQVLNTPPERRPTTLDEDVAAFTYINGDLFEATLQIPACNESLRTELLDACRFDWSIISPAIFGSMFQNVMAPAERRQLGAHYTTEENILKTIRPLFLNDLEAELSSASTTPKLNDFHDKLATLRFMDPACGCGNFLVIAYREIRRLETEALRKLAKKEVGKKRGGQRVIGLNMLCKVTVDQFYGIEIDEWPARIARTALYLIDHIANRDVSAEFGEHFVRFPIPAAPHIRIDNALRIRWEDVLPADQTPFVFGNPPFVGMYLMNDEQNEDNAIVFETQGLEVARSGRLDYVACWYAKAIEYAGSRSIRFAFVSTNSLTQGEQARSLGPFLLDHGISIDFAHRTFAWSSEARGTAHVHVVIVGFSKGGQSRQKHLFEYPDLKGEPIERRVSNINFYLADAPDVAVAKHTQPFIPLPLMTKGSQPTDDGNLIVEPEDYDQVMADPHAAKYVRRLVGAKDMIHRTERWCLWLVDADPADIHSSPILRHRLDAVATWRRTVSRTASVQAQAATPGLFTQIRQPKHPYLCIPRHSSWQRRIIPMTMFAPNDIAHDSTLTLDDPPLWLFGVLQSGMFTAWVQNICGRLKSDIRVEPDIAYNAFPFIPELPQRADRIEPAAQKVLDARAAFPTSSLAALYDPLATPPALSKAHDALDTAVDSVFAPRRRFTGEAERLAVLLEHYQRLTSPLLASSPRVRKRA
jgi:hypothetical protein